MAYKFGIVGYGYVGRATHLGILKYRECVVHDINFHTKLEDLREVENIFICIPTFDQNDVKKIADILKKIKKFNKKAFCIIRSTLPIGSCKKLLRENSNLIYMPEFLRERFWREDCEKRPLVVGYDGKNLPNWLLEENIERCTTVEAELIKMFANNFAVMRIAYANIFYDLSQSFNANYNQIKDIFLKIKNDQEYFDMPGHDGTRGFGGNCLPKDLDFLIQSIKDKNPDHKWFSHIKKLNKKWQKKY